MLFIALLLFTIGTPMGPSVALAQKNTMWSPDGGELTPEEEASLREASKKMPPAEVDDLISQMKASRREAVSYRSNPQKLRDELLGLAEQMKANSSPSAYKKFREARDKLDRRLRWFQNVNTRVNIPPEIGSPLAETLIDAFANQTTPDHLPITVAAYYGNSRRVKDYLLSILDGNEEWKQKEVLHGITALWKGDAEIYSALDKLYERNGSEDTFVLTDMEAIDKDRTLPTLLKLIDTTTNPTIFYQTTSMAASYHRTDVLEHVFRRVRDIPLTGRRFLPGLCDLPPDVLLGYIKGAEGEKLRFALDAFVETHAALKDGYSKLSSRNPESRRAIVECIGGMAKRGTWANEQTLDDLEQFIPHETDSAIRKEAEDVVGWLKLQQQLH